MSGSPPQWDMKWISVDLLMMLLIVWKPGPDQFLHYFLILDSESGEADLRQ